MHHTLDRGRQLYNVMVVHSHCCIGALYRDKVPDDVARDET